MKQETKRQAHLAKGNIMIEGTDHYEGETFDNQIVRGPRAQSSHCMYILDASTGLKPRIVKPETVRKIELPSEPESYIRCIITESRGSFRETFYLQALPRVGEYMTLEVARPGQPTIRGGYTVVEINHHAVANKAEHIVYICVEEDGTGGI